MSTELPHPAARSPAPVPAAAERHIARGTIPQQLALGWVVLVMLAVVTALGRTLSLTEFGLYGLAISVAAYVLVVQYSVETSAVRAIAGAPDGPQRDTWFSTAVAIYLVLGLFAGLFVAVGGIALAGVLGIPDALRDEARSAFLALGAVTAIGWPTKACQDALRGTQRFGAAALGEILAYSSFGAIMAVLLLTGARLWALIAAGGSLSLLIGVVCLVILVVSRVGPHLRLALVTRARARELLGVSDGLLVAGVAAFFL